MHQARPTRRGVVVAGVVGAAGFGVLGTEVVRGLVDGPPPTGAGPLRRGPAYGACPADGGTSLAAQRSVLDKWGHGACVRQFFPGFSVPAPRDPGVSVVHASWKPRAADVITPARVAALTADLREGDVVEVWHEPDVKVREGVLDLAEVVERKNRFHDAVRQARPDLRVACTLSGWEADPANPRTHGDLDRWSRVRADLLGLDLDGVHPEHLPYPDYHAEADGAVAFVAQHGGYRGWCVPELGAPRIEGDTDGTARAEWLLVCGLMLDGADAAYVSLFEYPTVPGYELTSKAELAAWGSFV